METTETFHGRPRGQPSASATADSKSSAAPSRSRSVKVTGSRLARVVVNARSSSAPRVGSTGANPVWARSVLAAEAIEVLATELAAARSAVIYGRMGTSTQAFGCLTTWLIDVINIVTGNFDRPGGAMFTTPAVDLAGLARRLRESGKFDRWRSRVGNLPGLSRVRSSRRADATKSHRIPNN